jgi:hypothetical protein
MTSPLNDDGWERLVATGTHAYLFVDDVEGRLHDAVAALRSAMPDATERRDPARAWSERGWGVLSASEFVGPFAAFAHLRVEGGLADLQDFIAALRRDLGIRGDLAVAGGSPRDDAGLTMMAKAKRCEVVALVKVWVRKGTAETTLTALRDGLGGVFDGATIVFGGFDILLELGAEELGSVLDAALGRLQELEDVVRTETAVADFRRYDGSDG